MGLNWAEHTVEIAAPIETCFAAIIDYETFPSWQGAVVDTEVLDWDNEGRGKRVRLFIDAKIRRVDYTLDYSYEEPVRIEWDFVEGNGISDADGHYLFEDLGGDRTRATYKLGLEVGLPLPGPVARRAHRSTLKGSVEDLRREAERQAASTARASNRRRGSDREARLAERAGTSEPRPDPAAPDESEEWAPDYGSGSIAELPARMAGRALSVGRRATEGGIRAARGVSEEAAGAGFGAARRAIGVGVGLAGAVTDRAARLVRRGSRPPDEYPR
ncbi:MAG TPA: SRPBCC family protein [Solirubrobacterales bacterium]|nr:SRPBCC family protein [Solirubrobacterales bacterium]